MSMFAPEPGPMGPGMAPPPGMPPPDLGGMMGMMGPGMGPEMMGPSEEAPPQSPAEALRTLITGVLDYIDIEPDDEDKAVAAKILAQLQGLLAQQQKQRDQALGAGPAQKFMRRGY